MMQQGPPTLGRGSCAKGSTVLRKVNGEELGRSRTNHVLERWGRITGWNVGVLLTKDNCIIEPPVSSLSPKGHPV